MNTHRPLDSASSATVARGSSRDLYEQEADVAILVALAPFLRRRLFVDVGAERGAVASRLLDLGFEGILLEPYPPHVERLRRRFAGRSATVHALAVDDHDHPGELHVAVGADGAALDFHHSLVPSAPHALFRHGESLPVVCRSLGALVEGGVVPAEVGILKIDTDGNELKVLEGTGRLRSELVMCEFVTPRLYPGAELAFPARLVAAARRLGFDRTIAIKRFASAETIVIDPATFADGEWGNLIFLGSALLDRGRAALEPILESVQVRLVELVEGMARDLEAKEEIRQLDAACRERLELIERMERALRELEAERASPADPEPS